MLDADDHRLLTRAIAIATGAGVRSSPNPGVGCVIALDGRVIAEGVTAVVGGPHAEAVALAAAGSRARGATAYVTLEPCAHHGRTPPCAPALIAAGIRRVLFVHADPNPIAAQGAAMLTAHGLDVTGPMPAGGMLHAAVADQLAGFLTVERLGRPHVTLKLAQTRRGSLGSATGWVTGDAARRAVHRWRARCDAVLVGSGTVVGDDPRLDVRDAAVVRQPRAVVLDRRLRTDATARVARPGTIVVTTDDAPGQRRRRLTDVGVEVVEVAASAGGGVGLIEAMASLAARGLTTVFAEPGRTLAAALLEAGLVDRVVLHVADGVADRAFAPAVDLDGWRIVHLAAAGGDRIVEYAPGTKAA